MTTLIKTVFCVFLLSHSLPAISNKSAITILGRGGVNLATASELSDSFAGMNYTSFSFGIDAWYGFSKKVDIGLSVNWVEAFDRDSEITTRILSVPVLLEGRYYLYQGFYAGAGAGISPGVFSYFGQNYTVWGGALSLRSGYDYEITKRIIIGADAHMIFLLQNIEFFADTSNANFSSTTKSASQANFLISAHVGYRI